MTTTGKRFARCGCPDCHCQSNTDQPVCGFCRTGYHVDRVVCVHRDGSRVDITEIEAYEAHDCSDGVACGSSGGTLSCRGTGSELWRQCLIEERTVR